MDLTKKSQENIFLGRTGVDNIHIVLTNLWVKSLRNLKILITELWLQKGYKDAIPSGENFPGKISITAALICQGEQSTRVSLNFVAINGILKIPGQSEASAISFLITYGHL
jgi:hypothetical protein